MASNSLPDEVERILDTSKAHNQRTVLLTCGISGSGKSSLARSIVEQYPTFVRLSIDKYIFERYGVFGSDYREDEYERLQDEAHGWVVEELARVVGEGSRNVVVDLSFWERAERERWKEKVERVGGGR